MRTALRTAAALACLFAGCLDTAPDPSGVLASDAGAAGRGSEKPPVAPSTPGAAGAGGSGSGATIVAQARGGGDKGKQGSQPLAAGAGAVHARTSAAGVGGSAGAGHATAGHPELPRVPSPTRAGDLVISELMIDPKALPDTQGEWFELYNASSVELSLHDCQLDDGAEALHAIAEPLLIQPGAYATLARGPEPGFVPSATVALSLTNTADTLAIICTGVEIDRVSYDKAAGSEIKPGVTLSLDPDALSARQNDVASAWCAGQNDLGTPGRANPSCHAADETEDLPEEEPDAGTGSEDA